MDPATIALLVAAALLLKGGNSQPYGQGSSTTQLARGTYRVRFKAAATPTKDFDLVKQLPHITMMGWGANTQFESLTIDRADPTTWWFTGIMFYPGDTKTVNLLPGMTVQPI